MTTITQHRPLLLGLAAVAALLAASAVAAQPRAGARPNLSGIWQALDTANWDLEAHAAEPGPVASLGALFAVPPGPGVVVEGAIPYLSAALEQRRKNREQRWTDDPERKCFMPLPQRRPARGRTLHAAIAQRAAVRSEDRGPESVLAALDDSDAVVSAHGG
jgi:hypothetical protein